MSKVRADISVSVDGYVAGPNQSMTDPLGEGGEGLHDWVVTLDAWRRAHGEEGGEVNASSQVVEERQANIGAGIMGRNMFFGGGRTGPWDESWTGWWGEDPPFHVPTFVLTHHPRKPVTVSDTTYHFVTDGITSAYEQAREAAGRGGNVTFLSLEGKQRHVASPPAPSAERTPSHQLCGC